MDPFKPPTLPPAQANKTARILACIKLMIWSAQKSIKTKIGIVCDAEIEAEAFTSLPKIKANLQVLEDVLHITNNNLNLISNQVLSDELNEEQASALINEVTNLNDTSTHTVIKLRAKLLEVAAVL